MRLLSTILVDWMAVKVFEQSREMTAKHLFDLASIPGIVEIVSVSVIDDGELNLLEGCYSLCFEFGGIWKAEGRSRMIRVLSARVDIVLSRETSHYSRVK